MARYYPFLITPLLWVASIVDAGAPATLEQAAAAMLSHDASLKAGRLRAQGSAEDVWQARSAALPQVSVGTNLAANRLFNQRASSRQADLSLSLRQLVYDGGEALSQTSAARSSFHSARFTERENIEARMTDLVAVYLDILRTQQQVALARSNVEAQIKMRKLLESRQALDENRSSIALVKGRLEQAVDLLSRQRLENDLAVSRFERYVGEPPGGLKFPDIPSIPSSADGVDFSKNYQVKAAKHALDSARHTYQTVQTLRKPRFYLDASVQGNSSHTSGFSQNQTSGGLAIVGNWTMKDGGSRESQIRQEQLRVEEYQALLEEINQENRLRADLIIKQRKSLANSVNTLSSYAKELAIVRDDYEQLFEVGYQDLMSILDTQLEYNQVISQRIDTSFQRHSLSFEMLALQGLLAEYLVGDRACDLDDVDLQGSELPRFLTKHYPGSQIDRTPPTIVNQGQPTSRPKVKKPFLFKKKLKKGGA